ncbi:hypothetical protein HDK77DRAFT_310322 [Phyllosticta capitalensis]
MWLAVTAGFCSLWVVFFFFFHFSNYARLLLPQARGAMSDWRRGWQLGNSCHHGPTPTMPSIIQFAEWELGCDERRMKRRIAVRRNGPGRACSIGTCLARRRQLVDGNETKHGVVGGKRRRKEGCCGLWDGLHM